MIDPIGILRSVKILKKPVLSVIVAFYNMEREAPRTLYTLSTKYQKGISEADYEVIAVDCGSTVPLDPGVVRSFGKNFSLVREKFSLSPVAAINRAVFASKGDIVMICIDGARLLSPGILHYTLASFRAFKDPVVATLNLHLGHKIQRHAMLDGYNQQVEDELLGSVDWMKNGYELFRISCIAPSGWKGWFSYFIESNCLSMRRSTYRELGGFHEEFRSPGGGLANIDFYKRAAGLSNALVTLIGEGTFHQFHNGIKTNAPLGADPIQDYLREYRIIRNEEPSPVKRRSVLIGEMPSQAYGLLSIITESILKNPDFI